MNQNAIQEAGFDWSCRFGMRNRLLNIKGVRRTSFTPQTGSFAVKNYLLYCVVTNCIIVTERLFFESR
ncbi:hypothetical protein O9426_17965, partial [Proteus mirabilis]|uniref:hypothetical protein n=1 Tax=Proteus mirabilis TaxID=584 RepID=UPI002578C312